MAAVLSTNMASLYAQKNLSTAQTALSASVQRLSSGTRINSAKDDAAGYGISESLKGTKNIVDQSIRNTKDAISQLQTAEGALDVVGKMLQRVLTLTTQRQDGTLNSDQTDSINNEIASLLNEIQNVKERTQFQGGSGSVFGTTNTLSTGTGVASTIEIANLSLGNVSASSFTIGGLGLVDGWYDVSAPNHGFSSGDAITYHVISGLSPIANLVDGQTYYVIAEQPGEPANGEDYFMLANTREKALSAKLFITQQDAQDLIDDGTAIQITAPAGTSSAYPNSSANPGEVGYFVPDNGGAGGTLIVSSALGVQEGQGVSLLVDNFPITPYFGGTDLIVTSVIDNPDSTSTITLSADSSGNFFLELIDGGEIQFVDTGIASFTKGSNSFGGLGIVADSLTSEADANAAGLITNAAYFDAGGNVQSLEADDVANLSTSVVQDAIGINATNRSDLGIWLNRLEYSVDNMQTLSTNLADGISRIVDTDYAAETSNLTRTQILQQAATSMLAQANQMPNVILTLLK
ncbi:flagellin [Polynucleobacter sp. MWH-Berg-3C6]|uniref:flagellin N-terminal helical domain-containing protein n=1 Tax=Polynucleobacter sp. MWH-Berg-3C6 TaxID=1855882 RepID=UPI001C0E8DBC|nr:flagellin [Polynucleobacter sp. MWH-Berg-3C6]MBU3551384.1 hypothetical protein [Polynucleobacter sp. MWH-Berg-3C6]